MMRKNNHVRRLCVFWLTAVCLALFVLVTNTQSAQAHTRVEVGPYVIVLGWLNEPPIVGERNSLTIEITEDDQPVEGVEATLDAELVFGPETFRTNLNPTTTPGLYTAEIFPTVRGQYAVHLFGSIEEMEVDVTAEPEEVAPGSRIQFPEPLPDSRELQKEVNLLESEVQSTRTLAYVGLGLAAVSLLIAIVSLLRKRKPVE
jgi:hypothetical protein